MNDLISLHRQSCGVDWCESTHQPNEWQSTAGGDPTRSHDLQGSDFWASISDGPALVGAYAHMRELRTTAGSVVGDLLVHMDAPTSVDLEPGEARMLGQLLIALADRVDGIRAAS